MHVKTNQIEISTKRRSITTINFKMSHATFNQKRKKVDITV